MRIYLTSFAILLLTQVQAVWAAPLTVPDILDAAAMKDGSDGRPAIDPCHDFYQFACGQWIEKTAIPSDKNRVSHQSTALMDQTDEKLNKLILRIEKGDPALQTRASKQIVDYYNSCMNYSKDVSSAQTLLRANLAEVEHLENLTQLPALIAKLHREGTDVLFGFGSGQDLNDSNSVIGFLDQGGMGLGEPSFYFDKDAKSQDIRKKYGEHIAQIFQHVGQSKNIARLNARKVVAFETRLAEKAFAFDDRQNPAKTNHPTTREALLRLAPAIDWILYFQALGAPPSALNVNVPNFLTHMSEVVTRTPLADLKIYLQWQIAHRMASTVSPELDQENFNFWARYLHGEKKMKPRWKRCTVNVEGRLGYALAEVYVRTFDGQAIRAKTETMISEIEQAFRDDLDTLVTGNGAWLDLATKQETLKKLSKLKQKVGAPEKWRDYTTLMTDARPFLANDLKVAEFEAARDLAKIGKPVDRLEWDMMPWEINAYYNPPTNEFVFPFGILEPPMFDLRASEGANLGAFGGGTIGHELTHGFDNFGRQYDADGTIKDWWTAETKRKFDEKAQCFIRQANDYKIESVGLNVDGQKSLTENLADQGGVKLGYTALTISLAKRTPAPLWRGKYSENQQFWIAYAQSWCGKAQPETLRQQIKTDPHPPEEFRVNAVLMNRPEFGRDFSCKEGSRMTPQVRCSIW
jgi:endothelin-converting enzyme/putative endopeptidase